MLTETLSGSGMNEASVSSTYNICTAHAPSDLSQSCDQLRHIFPHKKIIL